MSEAAAVEAVAVEPQARVAWWYSLAMLLVVQWPLVGLMLRGAGNGDDAIVDVTQGEWIDGLINGKNDKGTQQLSPSWTSSRIVAMLP